MLDRDYITRQQVIRRAMLEKLYDLRRQAKSGFARDLTHTLGHNPVDCEFALAYLVESGQVRRESIHCHITAAGIDHFETEQ